MDIKELKYNDQGLIPAIITDARTGKVLMLAYMNSESLEITIKEERTCFFSRSRNELWRKGETSGNVQQVVSIATDCDKDTLLISVIPAGPACHTGNETCFFNTILENAAPFTIQGLMDLIIGRKTDKKEGSYTTYLFEKGRDKILKKVGEEATEVIIGGKADDKAETIYELADLMYHALVLMADMDISVDDVMKELASRHVIDKKVKQEKMA
ncbi:MAG: bifunctional phosphoribosyl-AMP cyclohydrolase/phosphoribosyl-ATP diphosphatase HisIE [Ruminococcaceae bacterium]|nr:bifunctional phosphoribosyl-AMP cyclohydrolase/phosphoribosyl-ATP diphosphatase HisIE [Oscillospiraceae bacterium]